MSIGEFSERSRLSPKALRLYSELGVLAPVRVDEESGYRYYAPSQLDDARMIAALRQLQIPLAEIKSILQLDPPAGAARIEAHWNALESEHASRRDLAAHGSGLGVRLTYIADASTPKERGPDCDFAVPLA